MTPDLYILNWKSSYDVMLLMFQSRQQHFAEFYFVRFLDQGYARIILSTTLNLRIISIKRFFSRLHACVPMIFFRAYEIYIDTEHFPNEILLCSCSI